MWISGHGILRRRPRERSVGQTAISPTRNTTGWIGAASRSSASWTQRDSGRATWARHGFVTRGGALPSRGSTLYRPSKGLGVNGLAGALIFRKQVQALEWDRPLAFSHRHLQAWKTVATSTDQGLKGRRRPRHGSTCGFGWLASNETTLAKNV